jgi:hypothetical protein
MNPPLAETWNLDLIPDITDPKPDSRPAHPSPLAENAENAEFPPVSWPAALENSANSAFSAGRFVQKAVLPPNTILTEWFDYARQHTEGADCYLAGCILPVMGALLGRRVWMQLGGTRKFANIFALICGKPGDRKSTTIRLAATTARHCLPGNAFLPENFSPESLFDEYDETCGGRPDKLWIVDDANAVLTDWQKTQNGERTAARFLGLYDCATLSESFRRNKKESEDGAASRTIPETSTSVIFGATFNVACFQGQTVRAGMARRFLYYTAERRGCDIFDSPVHNADTLRPLVDAFSRCLTIEGEMHFTPDAQDVWRSYQAANRAEMDAASFLAEDLISRLSSAPAQVLAVAMIFEAAIWATGNQAWTGELSLESLQYAIDHVAESLEAARWLDGIAHRVHITEDAEVLFTRILRDFAVYRRGDTIYARRNDLTRAYCHDSARRGAMRPHDLYHRLLPTLIGQGKAQLAMKEGKKEVYAFRVEE